MTVVTIDMDSFGGMVAGLCTILVGIYTYLNQRGYIQKWMVKLSIDDDVANIATTASNDIALLKLSIPDELIDIIKEIAADPEGGIDAQKIINILNDRNEIEKILGSNKPLTVDEKAQIQCIMMRIMKAYKKESSAPPVNQKKPGEPVATPDTTKAN